MALTWRWKLQTGAALDLNPSMHWRAPAFVLPIEDNQGPILMIVEYKIDPRDSAAFLALMQEIGRERRRDGGYAWHVFDDPAEPGRIVETCLIHSMLELRYRQARVTMADRIIEDRANAFLREPRKERYLVAPARSRHRRREQDRMDATPPLTA